MMIDIPTKIVTQCLRDGRCAVRTIHGRMVFKTVFADMLHQKAQLRDLNDGLSADCVQRVVRENALANKGADRSGHLARVLPERQQCSPDQA